MKEAILIEMSRRFRALEDAIGKADGVLLAREQFLARKMVESEQRIAAVPLDKPEARESVRLVEEKIYAPLEKERERVMDIRTSLEFAAEACRDDLVAMQESLRKTRAVA